MHVIFRADGDGNIGFGHLVRSSAIAQTVAKGGHDVSVVTTTGTNAAEIFPEHSRVLEVESRGDPTAFLMALPEDADIAIIDSYTADGTYQQTIRDAVTTGLVFDDDRHPVCADLAINGNLHAPGMKVNTLGDEPKWCLGPRYALLRPPIARLAKHDPPWRDTPDRALVTMGSSDTANLTPSVVQAFHELEVSVDVVVGPGFSSENARAIRSASNSVSNHVRIHETPNNLPILMFESDFAVTTASSTTYELLALGTPIVSRPVAENQRPIASALRDHDLAAVVDGAGGSESLRSAFTDYIENPGLRQDRRERGRSLVDGLGVDRVYSELLSL